MPDSGFGPGQASGDFTGALFQIAGPVAGYLLSQGDRDKVKQLLQQSMDEYGNIDVPKLQQLALQQMGPSQFGDIRDDPQYRDQQQSADAQLNDVINSGGLTLSDRAALNKVRESVNQDANSQRAGILADMSRRGTLDSGAQLASDLQSQQQAAQTESDAGQQTSAQAQARAYQAIQQRAQNAGQQLSRTQQLAEAKAAAQDAIAKGNVDIANTASKYNALLPQLNFENQMTKANADAGALGRMAGYHGGNAANTQQLWTGIGNGAAGVAQGAGQISDSGLNQANSLMGSGGGSGGGGGGAASWLALLGAL